MHNHWTTDTPLRADLTSHNLTDEELAASRLMRGNIRRQHALLQEVQAAATNGDVHRTVLLAEHLHGVQQRYFSHLRLQALRAA